jgi:hypothetical protein
MDPNRETYSANWSASIKLDYGFQVAFPDSGGKCKPVLPLRAAAKGRPLAAQCVFHGPRGFLLLLHRARAAPLLLR